MTDSERDDDVLASGVTFDQLLDGVRNGVADGRFDELYEALEARTALRNAQAMQNLRVGTRVVTSGNVKPRHRCLKWATVEELKPRSGKVVIRFDDRPSERWTWPAEQLAPQAHRATVPR